MIMLPGTFHAAILCKQLLYNTGLQLHIMQQAYHSKYHSSYLVPY